VEELKAGVTFHFRCIADTDLVTYF